MKFRPPFIVQTSRKHQENPSEYLIYRPLLQIITNRPPCMFQFSSFIPLEFFFHIELHIISNFWSIRSQFDSFQCEELFSAKYKIATGTLLNKEFIPQNWISNQIFFIIWAANSKYYKYYEWEHQTANTRGGKKTGWLRKHKTHQQGS